MFILLFVLVKAEELFIITVDIQANLVNSHINTQIKNIDQDSSHYFMATIGDGTQFSDRFDYLEYDNLNLDCYNQSTRLQRQSTCFITEKCQKFIKQEYLGITNITQEMKNDKTYIVDNTYYPCDGFHYTSIKPWVIIVSEFNIDKKYFYSVIIITVFFSLLITIELIAILVMYYKYQKLRRKQKRADFPLKRIIQ
ncbi:hypothetical protein pb186bvf_011692 [Paramecium bursaria]